MRQNPMTAPGGKLRGVAVDHGDPQFPGFIHLTTAVCDEKGDHAHEQYNDDDWTADGEWSAWESTQKWSQPWTAGTDRHSSWWMKKNPTAAVYVGDRAARSRTQAHENRTWESRFRASDNNTWEPRMRTRQWWTKEENEPNKGWSKKAEQLWVANDDTANDWNYDAPATEQWWSATYDHDDDRHRVAAMEEYVHLPSLPTAKQNQSNINEEERSAMRSSTGKYAQNTKSHQKGHRTSLGSDTPGSAKQAAQLYRTSLCAFFSTSVCNKGDECPHAHSLEELRHRPTLTKTRLCEHFHDAGQCSHGDNCVYAHGASELRATDSFFKTRMCRAGAKCKVGEKCRYAHSLGELQTPSKMSTAASGLSHTPSGLSEGERAKTEYSSGDALTSPTDNDTFRSSFHSQQASPHKSDPQEHYPVTHQRPYEINTEHRDSTEHKNARSPHSHHNTERQYAPASSAPKYAPTHTSKPQMSTDGRPLFARPPPRPTPPRGPASPYAKPAIIPTEAINQAHAHAPQTPAQPRSVEQTEPFTQHQIMQILLRQQLPAHLDSAFASDERYLVASDTASSSPQHRAMFEFSPSATGARPTCLLHLESALAAPSSYSPDYQHDNDMTSNFFPTEQHFHHNMMGSLASSHNHPQHSAMPGHLSSAHEYPHDNIGSGFSAHQSNSHRDNMLCIPMPDPSQCDMPTPEHSPRQYYINLLSIPTPDPSPRMSNQFEATPDHSPRLMHQFPSTPEESPRHFEATIRGSLHHFTATPDCQPHHFATTPQRSPHHFEAALGGSLHHHITGASTEDDSPYHFFTSSQRSPHHFEATAQRPSHHFEGIAHGSPHHMRDAAHGSQHHFGAIAKGSLHHFESASLGSPSHFESSSQRSPLHSDSASKGSSRHFGSPHHFEFTSQGSPRHFETTPQGSPLHRTRTWGR
eukprot:GEMP01004049.1.p1 GENE.GEMP01004049.1~~GEMP01004049.1.p1  ORF type:complete len:921 (+),score=191.39 GEMP01004049.1:493-3255(+)